MADKLVKNGVEDIILNLYNSMCGGCKFASICHKDDLKFVQMSKCVATVRITPNLEGAYK